MRFALSHTDTAVQAVADIEPDAHTEAPVVRPFLDANEIISARKVAGTSDWQPISVAVAAVDAAAASASGQAEPVLIGPDISVVAETAVEAGVVEVVEAVVVGEQIGSVVSAVVVVVAQGAVDEIAYSAGPEQQLETERFVEE